MSNGTVTYDDKKRQWRIVAKPHIAIRLKRVIGKLSRKHMGTLFLSDTEETARDLEWFLDRFPMDVESGKERLKERANAHRERIALVDALLSRRVPIPPFDLAIQARDYQRVGAAAALASGGLLIADELGVGKTVTGICMFTDTRTLPALVVTMTHLTGQWEREIKRFAPKLTTHIIKSTKVYDVTGTRDKGSQLTLPGAVPDVLIINYHKLADWAEHLAPIVRCVAFDECQELRSGGSRKAPAKWHAAHHLAESVPFRVGFSATPIYNHGSEFFSVIECLRPGVLGARDEFVQEWCYDEHGSGSAERIADPVSFGDYLRAEGLMLRRTRKDIGRELPKLTKIPHPIEANVEEIDKVSDACAELARTILKQGEAHKGEKLHASEELSNKLRQATGIAKAPFVAEFVKMLVENGEKVVLFGWHRMVYDIWLDRLKDCKPVMYTGSDTPVQKEASRKAFVEGDARVLIMSLRAGAGLDGLQSVCSVCVFGELDWSPGVHAQCEGRVDRDGQMSPTLAYYLIADHGADPIIVDVLGVKKQQREGVLEPTGAIVENLEVDGDRIKRLAENYLKQRGLSAPSAEAAA